MSPTPTQVSRGHSQSFKEHGQAQVTLCYAELEARDSLVHPQCHGVTETLHT